LPFFQNIGQAGRDGTPHKPLLPERLQKNKTQQIEEQRDYFSLKNKIKFYCIVNKTTLGMYVTTSTVQQFPSICVKLTSLQW